MATMMMTNQVMGAETPPELARLRARIEALPQALRNELEPLAHEAIEEAVYRGRVLNVAKEALQRFRLDLALTQFDLDATRNEREQLRRALEGSTR